MRSFAGSKRVLVAGLTLTLTLNFSDQPSKENGRPSNRLEMDMDMTDSSDEQEDDDDEEEEEENDDNDETTSDEDNTVANFPTPPTSDHNEDDNHN